MTVSDRGPALASRAAAVVGERLSPGVHGWHFADASQGGPRAGSTPPAMVAVSAHRSLADSDFLTDVLSELDDELLEPVLADVA